MPEHHSGSNQPIAVETDLEMYAPFIMKGYASLSEEDTKVPVTILRDIAALQSVILEGVLPLSDKSYVNSDTLVRGSGVIRPIFGG